MVLTLLGILCMGLLWPDLQFCRAHQRAEFEFDWPLKDYDGHRTCSKPKEVTHNSQGQNEIVVEETYVGEDGNIVFESLRYSEEYKLARHTACGDDWLLGPYVRLARNVITENKFTYVSMESLKKIVDGNVAGGLVEMANNQKPILGLGTIGLLTGLLLPFVGCCFCCCRCKGRCGGRLTTVEARNQRLIYCCTTFFLYVTVFVFLMTGTVALYQLGARLLHTNDQLTNTFNYTLGDVVTFTNEILDQLDQVVGTDLNFVVDDMVTKVENLGTTASEPLMTHPIYAGLQLALKSIESGILAIGDKLAEIDQTTSGIGTNDVTLGISLDLVRSVLDNRKSSCVGDGIPSVQCDLLPDGSDVGSPYNFSQTPSLEEQHNFHQEAIDLDIGSIILSSTDAYQSIPERIANGSRNTSSDVSATLTSIVDRVGPLTEKLRDQMQKATKNVGTMQEKIGDVHTDVDSFLFKIDYGLMGLAGAVLLLLLLASLGLIHGATGLQRFRFPERRSAIMHCGRGCLMTSACMGFLYGTIFFIIGSILFLFGAQLTMICVPIEDRSILKFVDGPDSWHGNYIIGDTLHGNGSTNVSLTTIIEDCKKNRAVFSTFQLDRIFNVSSTVNIEEQLPDMDSVYDSVRSEVIDVTIIENDTLSEMRNVSNTTATPMNVLAMMTDSNNGIDNLGPFLTALAELLQNAADDVAPHDSTYEAAYLSLKADVQALNDTTRVDLQDGISNMLNQLNGLDVDMASVVTALDAAIDWQASLSTFILNDGVIIILERIRGSIDDVIDEAKQFINHVHRRLDHDIGRCHVVWDIYDGLTYSLCSYFLDSLNGLWLSVSVIAIFLIPHIILAIKLSKYFRLPDDAIYVGRGNQRVLRSHLQPTPLTALNRA